VFLGLVFSLGYPPENPPKYVGRRYHLWQEAVKKLGERWDAFMLAVSDGLHDLVL